MTRRYVFDIEASGLLDDSTVDYTASPWKLKDTFVIHCIVAIEKTTGEVVTFVQDECYTKFKQWVIDNVDEIVHFNGINFDMLACKAALDMDYTVGPDTWCGKPVVIDDLYIKSKTLNPDRRGHSVEYFGELLGYEKIDWRAKAVELGLIEYNAPRGAEFRKYHPAMLDYCIRDVQVTCKIDDYLRKEWGDWPWDEAYELEKAVAEIITRQSHRGFWFDVELATENVKELDLLMAERKVIVEPALPEKPMGKTKLKEYIPGAKQFLKNGEPNSNIIKWCEKHGGTIMQTADGYQTTLYGKTYTLPIPQEPIVTTEPSKIDDTTFIKGFLVEMGWQPTQYKERDLTVDTRKQKLSQEKFKETIERYVEQTLNSPFCKDRCERVKATRSTLREKLLKHDLKKPLKVYTNPTLTVGQEKEIDPTLVEMDSEFPHTQSIVEYLTYKHRRNSILGGGLDPDDWDEEDDNTAKGFLANVRSDGRIPTPADTCGAATGRFKHRVTVNIPRVTSLYGYNMRAQFGIGDTKRYAQFAYDFASLEGRIEAHYCHRYDEEDKGYCNSLIQEKPFDVHTLTAKKVSELIGQDFSRQSAKSVKYACLPMDTKVLTKQGWKSFSDIREGDIVLSYNTQSGVVEDDVVLKKHFFTDKPLFSYSNKYDEFVCTEDHRWYGWKRKWAKRGVKRGAEYGFFMAKDITQEHNILTAAKYVWNEGCNISEDEARLLGWVCSDGYYSWSKLSTRTSAANGRKKQVLMSISQSENKYWKDIESLLARLGADYVRDEKQVPNENTVYSYRIKSAWARVFLDKCLPGRLDKHEVNWTEWLLSLSAGCVESFYDAFYLGDGNMLNRANGEIITQNKGSIADAIIACKLLGGSKVSVNSKSKDDGKCLVLRSQRRSHLTCQELKKSELGVAPTFCITTNNGTFIIKQETGYVGITGNCTYGAQAQRVAKTIGSDVQVGQAVYDAFWQAALPLALLKERLTEYWKTKGGKQFILGLDGRKIRTRSEHALLNSLFQSAGVICAKRTMLFQDRLQIERNISVDFWKDDWKNSQYIQQLGAFHDEAQCEITKGLVQWKMFADKESCVAFVQDNPEWVGPGKSERGFFAALSPANQIVKDAVEMTNSYYKLNVPLAVDPQYGRNWAECH